MAICQPVRLGAHCLNHGASWDELLDAALLAEDAGLDSISAMDHVQPIFNLRAGPTFEGWLTAAAWAARTTRVEIGLLVSAVGFRPPALLAKMATTLDHISGGRAFLGIGAGWNDAEHRSFGIDLPERVSERLAKLEEALTIIRPLLREGLADFQGDCHQVVGAKNDPLPIRRPLPIVIGGQGPRVTMRLVAQYADAVNVLGSADTVAHAEIALREHCRLLGRDDQEIERTAMPGLVVIRDREREARRVAKAILGPDAPARLDLATMPIGTPEAVAQRLRPYVELGYRNLHGIFPAPFDQESIRRFSHEVRHLL
jgi:alkanesulfonate monooxygenase SsuD/methylene tetrahydromethanopterin reductase-like flavin-dependent oxidoreductase (luciferase family)